MVRGNSVSAHERLGIDDREKRGNNKKLRESLISKKLECAVSNFREASNWVSKETGASNWVSIFEISQFGTGAMGERNGRDALTKRYVGPAGMAGGYTPAR
jgi:hypothetical protein